ncbi:hypothetical protein [Gayadomonas joobiniege]|uniref:hypothetical protein n=1 Tax=Gayadomonas joobiniege TaxID=1234606 RepID=UPI000373EF74|nr:hypothetical protein [Gayadomonas joobiniege]
MKVTKFIQLDNLLKACGYYLLMPAIILLLAAVIEILVHSEFLAWDRALKLENSLIFFISLIGSGIIVLASVSFVSYFRNRNASIQIYKTQLFLDVIKNIDELEKSFESSIAQSLNNTDAAAAIAKNKTLKLKVQLELENIVLFFPNSATLIDANKQLDRLFFHYEYLIFVAQKALSDSKRMTDTQQTEAFEKQQHASNLVNNFDLHPDKLELRKHFAQLKKSLMSSYHKG